MCVCGGGAVFVVGGDVAGALYADAGGGDGKVYLIYVIICFIVYFFYLFIYSK